MLSSAVSVLILAQAALAPERQLSTQEQSSWARLQPSIAYIGTNGNAGVAALIDQQGLYLSDRKYIPGTQVDAKFSDGKVVHLSLVRTDEATNLALLKGEPEGGRRALPVYSNNLIGVVSENSPLDLMAVLPNGPMKAELVGNSIGIIGAARRAVPFTEIHFEGKSKQLGGAILCTMDGRLVGILSATVDTGMRSSFAAKGLGSSNLTLPEFGPKDMTVAYSIAPSVLSETVRSLMSPHQVERPAIGVFLVKDTGGHGALVHSVRAGSTAEAAGIKVGDIITHVDGARIPDQISFARIIATYKVGDTVQIQVSRDNKPQTFEVKVGKE